MLITYRNVGESLILTNTMTNEVKEIKLISYEFPHCTLQINGEIQVKTQPESFILFEDEEAYVTIISIDRGVKLGTQAPKHIRISRS